jgi:hypothetical protein
MLEKVRKLISQIQKKPKILSRISEIIIWTLLIFLIAWAGKGIFKYNIYSTHDGDHHIARSFDVIKTISEGHFPLRWAGTLNYGCGVPIYNFFYPLLYYLVALFYLLFKNVIFTLKIINFLSLFIGTIFFYLWMREESRNKWSAFAGAVLYLYAPYRFSLIYVRGSPEYLAYALLPVVLFFFSLVFREKSSHKALVFAFLSALAGGFLTISHNFTVLFLMPIILLYLVVKFFSSKGLGLKRGLLILFSYLSAFGFGAFFIFPALLEQKFTKIGIDPIITFKDHFPTLWQLLRSKWGYFYSSIGTENDGMSFQLGYAHWLVLGIVSIWIVHLLYFLLKKKTSLKKLIEENLWIFLLFLMSVISIFLMLEKSLFIWKAIPFLSEIQFPWRLLGISVFLISSLFVYWVDKLQNIKIYWFVIVAVSLLAFIGNRSHLLPQPISVEDLFRYEDFERFHPHRYSTTTLGDDVIARNAPNACWFDSSNVSFSDGSKIKQELLKKGSTFGSIKININKNDINGRKIVLRLGYFPGAYRIEANGIRQEYEDCSGLVCLNADNLRDKYNLITWQIGQTPIESFFNYVTLLFLILWIALLFFVFKKRKIKLSKKKVIPVLILIITFGVFSFLRFYDLPKRIGFGWDQQRDAWAVKEMLVDHKPPLLGPRVLGPSSFFLPPSFFYLLTPFYLVSGLSPYAIAYFSVFYNILFFVLSGLILNKLFGERRALLFLIIWAIHPYIISMDLLVWNPSVIPLMFILLIWLINKALVKDSPKMIFLIGLILGLGTSFHVQFLLLSPIVIPILFKKVKVEVKSYSKKILALIAGFILPFFPLFVFDLRHDFLNSRLILDFTRGLGSKNIFSYLPVWNNVVSRFVNYYSSNYVGVIFYLVVLGLLLYAIKIELKNHSRRSLLLGILLVWIFAPIFFAIYGARPSEYYFDCLIPIIVLVFAFFTSKLLGAVTKFRYVMGILLFFLVTSLVYKDVNEMSRNSLYLYYTDKSMKFLSDMTYNSKKFNVSFDTDLSGDGHFRYLMDYYRVKYTGDPADTLIEVVVPPDKKPNTFAIGGVGIYFPEGWFKENWPGLN